MNENENLVPKRRFKEFTNTGTWEQRKLGDMVEFFSGLTYSPDNVIKQPGTLVLRSSNVQNGEIVNADNVYVDNEVVNSDNVQVGDIAVVVRNGSRSLIGKHAAIKYPMKDTVIGAFMTGVRSDTPSFTNALLDTQQFETEIAKNLGATINQITTGNFKKMIFNFPEIDERLRIGDFFNQLDNTIALHQQKQRQIRSLKQGFIKNLFPNNKNSAPRIRFSIFNDDWNQRNASEIFTSVSDKNYPELPVLSASQEKGMVLRESNGIDIKYDQKSTGTYKRVLPGQFVMHLRSFQGGFAYSTIEGITSPAYTILAFRNKEDHYPLFWKSIFSSKNFIKRLEAITYGIRDGRSISYADFSTLRFWIPSYEEQKQIGDFIESIDATIAFYQRQIDMMQSLKKELLNKMFI